jgi:hypothetical protein
MSKAALRDAIAEALWEHVSANELAAICVSFGLPPQDPDEADPMSSKRSYVKRRLFEHQREALLGLARAVYEEYPTAELAGLFSASGYRGVDGELKNLIFAANGPKPEIVLRDAINNTIEIVRNAEHFLVYDRPLAENGLTWREMVNWWSSEQGQSFTSELDAGRHLYDRLPR